MQRLVTRLIGPIAASIKVAAAIKSEVKQLSDRQIADLISKVANDPDLQNSIDPMGIGLFLQDQDDIELAQTDQTDIWDDSAW